MAALVWDEQSQAWTEPTNLPMRYDPGSDAFVETTGMAWDAEAQAREEKWSPRADYVLYDHGELVVPYNSIHTGSYGGIKGAVTFNSDNFYIYTGVGNVDCEVYWKADVTNYNKVVAILNCIQANSSYGHFTLLCSGTRVGLMKTAGSGTFEIDISNVSGEVNISTEAYYANGYVYYVGLIQ